MPDKIGKGGPNRTNDRASTDDCELVGKWLRRHVEWQGIQTMESDNRGRYHANK